MHIALYMFFVNKYSWNISSDLPREGNIISFDLDKGPF